MTEATINPLWKLPSWNGRVRTMARMLPRGRILDVGAGSQSLRGFLPSGSTYDAADLDGPLVVDFDAGVYPDGHWDTAVLSGSLEYAGDPADVLMQLRPRATAVLVSYCHGGSLAYRRGRGWHNHLSRAAFEEIAELAGWWPYLVARWRDHAIYRLEVR